MRALVTGGAGFIGSHLVDRLVDQSHEVLVVDDLSTGHADNLAPARARGGVKLHQLDIRDESLTKVAERFLPDVVFHLAAQAAVPVSVKQPRFDAEVNVVGTINVLEAARRSGTKRVVFASSGGAIYGSAAPLPVREDLPKAPDSPYGISKKIVEDYFRYYRASHDIDYVLLALANVYGPRQDAQGEAGVVALFASAMLQGRPPTIFGDGEQTRDFVYVEDVADAFPAPVIWGDPGCSTSAPGWRRRSTASPRPSSPPPGSKALPDTVPRGPATYPVPWLTRGQPWM